MSRRPWVRATVAVAALAVLAPPGARAGTTPPLTVDVTSNDGRGRIVAPGLSCDEGGDGAYWHYDYSSTLPAGPGHGFSTLPGSVRLHLDLHSDVVRFPNTSPQDLGEDPRAFLLGEESHASLLNARGTLKLRMATGGGCEEGPTMAFDGVTAAGNGTWAVDSGTGAYEGATGAGTFGVTADVAPGADNAMSLQLHGAVAVLQPELTVEVVSTFWGNLGIDYVTRRVSVTYRITNTGPGHAYNAVMESSDPLTNGVIALGPAPQPLGDLQPGESAAVTVRYQLGLLQPCNLVILGCVFSTRTIVDWVDALDVPSSPSVDTTTQAPVLPPPL